MELTGTDRRNAITDDTLAHMITALETLKDVSSAVGTIPFLSVVFASAVSLISTIQQIRADRGRSLRFAKRVSDLMVHVERSMKDNSSALDDKMVASLELLQSSLTEIQEDLVTLTKKRVLSCFLQRAFISERLDELLEKLEDTSRSFNLVCLITLQQKVNQGSHYNDQQMRLFRFCDLRLQRSCGKWHSRDGMSGDEWSGEWLGRAVTISSLRAENSTEV